MPEELTNSTSGNKGCMNFNHIDTILPKESVEELKHYYRYYHKLTTCYKWTNDTRS